MSLPTTLLSAQLVDAPQPVESNDIPDAYWLLLTPLNIPDELSDEQSPPPVMRFWVTRRLAFVTADVAFFAAVLVVVSAFFAAVLVVVSAFFAAILVVEAAFFAAVLVVEAAFLATVLLVVSDFLATILLVVSAFLATILALPFASDRASMTAALAVLDDAFPLSNARIAAAFAVE